MILFTKIKILHVLEKYHILTCSLLLNIHTWGQLSRRCFTGFAFPVASRTQHNQEKIHVNNSPLPVACNCRIN